MHAQLFFSLASFGLSAYAYYPYYKEIRSGKAHPTISTWLCWLSIDAVLLAGMAAEHAVAIQVVAYVLGCLLVLYACLRARAPLGWWWLDNVCVALVALAMVGWALSGNPVIAIAITGGAFFVSCGPMFINLYRTPEREPFVPWLISWLGACCGMLAVPAWDITNALTPLIFFVLGFAVIVLIGRKFAKDPAMSLLK